MRTMLIALVFCMSVAVAANADSNEGYILTKNQRTLKQIDSAYGEMPPVEYRAPSARWERLPLTRQRIASGGSFHVVMLGDSIVNDTSRSCWNLLLERAYPDVQIHKVTSVRGSTGCWWYKEPGRVEKFVLDHQPELVIIGGISQRDDIPSIRTVVQQIRQKSQTDILLMTGCFGRVDPLDEAQWRRISDPAHHSDYRKELEKLAEESGSAFLDMELAWARNIRQSGKPLDWFKRDPVHANEKGEQILGRILATFLSPQRRDFILTQEG